MFQEIECPRCGGEGWTMQRWTFQERTHVTDGDCEYCNGHGYIAVDCADEIEDWMHDE